MVPVTSLTDTLHEDDGTSPWIAVSQITVMCIVVTKHYYSNVTDVGVEKVGR